jgi:hypothetical protein
MMFASLGVMAPSFDSLLNTDTTCAESSGNFDLNRLTDNITTTSSTLRQ